MRHFDVQMVGGMVLNARRKIAEHRRRQNSCGDAGGPHLNTLPGKEALHVVTVNDYLARRDATGWDASTCYRILGRRDQFHEAQ